MPAGLWVVLYACQAAPVGAAWVQGRHFTAFGGRGGVLRADGEKPRRRGGVGILFMVELSVGVLTGCDCNPKLSASYVPGVLNRNLQLCALRARLAKNRW